MSVVRIIENGPEAWRLLQGIFCVYKPPDMSIRFLRKVLISNICRDLCKMKQPIPPPLISIKSSVDGELELVKLKDYSATPQVLGPPFQPNDIKLSCAPIFDNKISGVCVVGVNKGGGMTNTIRESRLIRTFQIEGKFGFATDTHFHDGQVKEKSKFSHVTKSRLNKVLMSIQAGHQRKSNEYLGVDLQSQAAYEAIVQDGLVRPSSGTPTLLYALNIVDFNPPDFTIEVSCINEDGDYLTLVIHEIGMMLKTNATCTKIRCIRYGPWTLRHALLRKHWTVEHIIDSINNSREFVKKITPETPSLKKMNDYSQSNSKPLIYH
ncbi:unnamed protein product, partial [Meganyctiphanes norvegica]